MKIENEHPAAAFVDRLMNLEERLTVLRRGRRAVLDEAKEAGFSKGALQLIVKRLLETDEQRANRKAIESEAEMIVEACPRLAPQQGDLFAEDLKAAAQPRRGRLRKVQIGLAEAVP